MTEQPRLLNEEQLKEVVDCPLCKSALFEVVMPGGISDTDGVEHLQEPFRSMVFQLVRCTSCKTVYLRERPTQAQIAHFYTGEYHCYKPFKERGFLMCTLAKLLANSKVKVITSLMPKASNVVLDYGCGSGSWIELMLMAKVPFDMVGVDIIPQQIETVKKLGVPAFVSDENNLASGLGDKRVALVHLNHVIEHLPDPVHVLKKLDEVLVPGGIVYGQTPNIDSFDSRYFGRYWVQWHVPRHLVLYTPETLAKHAEAAGFQVLFIKNSLSSATNWANSFLKKAALEAGKDFQLSSHPLYPLLILSMIPITMFQLLFGKTSNIDFAFRKPG